MFGGLDLFYDADPAHHTIMTATVRLGTEIFLDVKQPQKTSAVVS